MLKLRTKLYITFIQHNININLYSLKVKNVFFPCYEFRQDISGVESLSTTLLSMENFEHSSQYCLMLLDHNSSIYT